MQTTRTPLKVYGWYLIFKGLSSNRSIFLFQLLPITRLKLKISHETHQIHYDGSQFLDRSPPDNKEKKKENNDLTNFKTQLDILVYMRFLQELKNTKSKIIIQYCPFNLIIMHNNSYRKMKTLQREILDRFVDNLTRRWTSIQVV